MKLNLASGMMYLDGYVNIDNFSMYGGRMKADKMEDVLKLQWEEGTVDEILVCHFMMYIPPLEAQAQVNKWFSWLKPGGKLIIETGNVKMIAQTILNSDDPNIINGTNGVMQLFGWATTVGHKWAWCYETIAPLLATSGFREMGWKYGGLHQRPERDLTITATK